MRDRRMVVRIALGLLAATSTMVGVWAAFAPRSFYDEFPGMGRVWVSVDGPYNEHLVRDVGQLNLGLAIVLVFAAVTLALPLVRAAAVAALVSGAPHFVYHLMNRDHLSTSDQVGELVSLGLGLVLPLIVLIAARNSSLAPYDESPGVPMVSHGTTAPERR